MAKTTDKISATAKSTEDLEADIRQLQADIAKLTQQLAQTGEHGLGAARRAAAQGAEHLRERVRRQWKSCAATRTTSRTRSLPRCVRNR